MYNLPDNKEWIDLAYGEYFRSVHTHGIHIVPCPSYLLPPPSPDIFASELWVIHAVSCREGYLVEWTEIERILELRRRYEIASFFSGALFCVTPLLCMGLFIERPLLAFIIAPAVFFLSAVLFMRLAAIGVAPSQGFRAKVTFPVALTQRIKENEKAEARRKRWVGTSGSVLGLLGGAAADALAGPILEKVAEKAIEQGAERLGDGISDALGKSEKADRTAGSS